MNRSLFSRAVHGQDSQTGIELQPDEIDLHPIQVTSVIRQFGALKNSSDIVVVQEKPKALARLSTGSPFLSTKVRSTIPIGTAHNSDKATAVSLNFRRGRASTLAPACAACGADTRPSLSPVFWELTAHPKSFQD